MECIICKSGTTKIGLVNIPVVRDEKIIFIKNIPAQICNNCGEYYLESEVAKEVYERANERMNQGVEIEVTQYMPANS